MDASEIIVLLGGIILIGLILWYFFATGEKVNASVSGDTGIQEIKVTVKGGYAPSTIVVRQGQPVRLNFYRDETSGCSEQVVFGDFGVVRDLPAFKTTPVEFTPHKSGEFVFTCGMNMLRGKLIVEAP